VPRCRHHYMSPHHHVMQRALHRIHCYMQSPCQHIPTCNHVQNQHVSVVAHAWTCNHVTQFASCVTKMVTSCNNHASMPTIPYQAVLHCTMIHRTAMSIPRRHAAVMFVYAMRIDATVIETGPGEQIQLPRRRLKGTFPKSPYFKPFTYNDNNLSYHFGTRAWP